MPVDEAGCCGPLPETPQVIDALALLRGDLRARRSPSRLADGPGVPTLGPASIEMRPLRSRTVRSVTLSNVGPKLFVDVTAEVPVATYEEGTGPDPAKVAGVDLGIIHPYALVSSRGRLVGLGPGHPG